MALPMTLGPEAALDPASDEHVVEEVIAGRIERFEILMRRYNQRLFRTARAILKDDAEAEDAVQQAYVSAHQKLRQFAGHARFSTWLTRITVNEALRRRRKKTRLADLEALPELADDDGMTPPPRSPEQAASDAELRQLLETAVDHLPEAYRVVLVLRDVEELSTRETAASLDLSEEAVRVRLHRARKAVREWLYERVDVESRDVFAFAGERCNRIVAAALARITGG